MLGYRRGYLGLRKISGVKSDSMALAAEPYTIEEAYVLDWCGNGRTRAASVYNRLFA